CNLKPLVNTCHLVFRNVSTAFSLTHLVIRVLCRPRIKTRYRVSFCSESCLAVVVEHLSGTMTSETHDDVISDPVLTQLRDKTVAGVVKPSVSKSCSLQ